MKTYIILFKYAGEWHIDMFHSEELDPACDKTKLWIEEAVRLAIQRQGLAKDDSVSAFEASVRELVYGKCEDRDAAFIGMRNPIDAVKVVKIQKNECR